MTSKYSNALKVLDCISCLEVSTGCPNKFGIRFVSETSIVYKKIVLCSKKLLIQPFLWTARNDNGFLSHFSPISNTLLNRLLHRIIGEKLPKNSSLIFAVHKKGWKSNFLEQNTFFPKIRNFHWQTSELQNTTFSQTFWDTQY